MIFFTLGAELSMTPMREMDAARSAKAPGGTVIHAKGTGAEHAKKFLGISLAEEKELIFTMVRSGQKNEIMRAIMEQSGPGTPAGGITFSLPVTATAGLRVPEPEAETLQHAQQKSKCISRYYFYWRKIVVRQNRLTC